MEEFNVIARIPRSGSTLLCNILNQNPDFFASSTSPTVGWMSGITAFNAANAEIKAEVENDREGTQDRLEEMLRGIIRTWYREHNVVFDKAHGWLFNLGLLFKLFPDAKVVICTRDLRACFGSIEKADRASAVYNGANSPIEKLILERADAMMGPDGILGETALGAQDAMARYRDNIFVMKHEAFLVDPVTKLKELYEFLGKDYYEHDLDNIEDVSIELDSLYGGDKFPHKGSGKVKKAKRNEWKEYVPDELATLIHGRFPKYNELFGY